MYLELFPSCLDEVLVASSPGVLEAGPSSFLCCPKTIHVRVGLRLNGPGLGGFFCLVVVDGFVEFRGSSAHTRRVGGRGVSALIVDVVVLVLSHKM